MATMKARDYRLEFRGPFNRVLMVLNSGSWVYSR